MKCKNTLKLSFALLLVAFPLSAQSALPSSNAVGEPRKVTYCDLAKDPAAYDHELVRLSAFVTHGFEDFHIAVPNCLGSSHNFSVWVMYGGTAESNTMYCCPGEGGQEARSKSLTVEGVEIPLSDDLTFQSFTDLLKKERDTTVRVTVVGRFFSGKKQTVNDSTYWGGYGHMGCCSLFAIQNVEAFERHTRSDVDYTAEAGWYEREGCDYSSLRYLRHVSIPYSDGEAERVIADQRLADSGAQVWAFNDPKRVALESLKPYYKGQVPVLRNVKKTAARQVFRWRDGKKSVVVVVAKPYWLSFYADSGSVAWVATTVKEAECGQHE